MQREWLDQVINEVLELHDDCIYPKEYHYRKWIYHLQTGEQYTPLCQKGVAHEWGQRDRCVYWNKDNPNPRHICEWKVFQICNECGEINQLPHEFTCSHEFDIPSDLPLPFSQKFPCIFCGEEVLISRRKVVL